MTITKIANIISIDNRDSYSKVILDHLDGLTEEEKGRKVNDLLIISDIVDVGPVFTLLSGGNNLASIIGLLELIKMYILSSEVDYE